VETTRYSREAREPESAYYATQRRDRSQRRLTVSLTKSHWRGRGKASLTISIATELLYLLSQSNGSPAFTAILERLKTNPSSDKPEVGNITYDFMIENLLRQVEEAVQKDTTVPKEDAEYKAALVKELNTHLTKLKDRQVDAQKDLDSELKEQAKHITSDDLHEGFDSGVSMVHRSSSINFTYSRTTACQ
jgi:hypothetical protein